jgi:hypothetical protein
MICIFCLFNTQGVQDICVGHLITKTLIEMAEGHISLSISPFLVIYANTSKSSKKKCNINAIEDQIVFDYNLAYLDRSLPPLGLFLHIKFIFLSLSQTRLFGHIENYSKRQIDQVPKSPPFPIIKSSNSIVFKIHKW